MTHVLNIFILRNILQNLKKYIYIFPNKKILENK